MPIVITQEFLAACKTAKENWLPLPQGLEKKEHQDLYRQLQIAATALINDSDSAPEIRFQSIVKGKFQYIPVSATQEDSQKQEKKGEQRLRLRTTELGSGAFGAVSLLDLVMKLDKDGKLYDVTTANKVDKQFSREEELAQEQRSLAKEGQVLKELKKSIHSKSAALKPKDVKNLILSTKDNTVLAVRLLSTKDNTVLAVRLKNDAPSRLPKKYIVREDILKYIQAYETEYADYLQKIQAFDKKKEELNTKLNRQIKIKEKELFNYTVLGMNNYSFTNAEGKQTKAKARLLGPHAMVMSKLKGKDLENYQNQGDGTHSKEFLDAFSEVSSSVESCSALFSWKLLRDAARILALGYIHSDIKPANIMVNPEGFSIQHVDFGLATQANQHNFSYGGTPLYLHPASSIQWKKNKPILSDADNTAMVCSLCVTLGWGNPANDIQWNALAENLLKFRNNQSKTVPSHHKLPDFIRENAKTHPEGESILAIMEKLLSSSSEGHAFYDSTQALQDLKPIFQKSLLNPKIAVFIDQLENEIEKTNQNKTTPIDPSHPDFGERKYRQFLLHSLIDLISLPKGAQPAFIKQRKKEIGAFLSKHQADLKELGYQDLAKNILLQVQEGNLLAAEQKETLPAKQGRLERWLQITKLAHRVENLRIALKPSLLHWAAYTNDSYKKTMNRYLESLETLCKNSSDKALEINAVIEKILTYMQYTEKMPALHSFHLSVIERLKGLQHHPKLQEFLRKDNTSAIELEMAQRLTKKFLESATLIEQSKSLTKLSAFIYPQGLAKDELLKALCQQKKSQSLQDAIAKTLEGLLNQYLNKPPLSSKNKEAVETIQKIAHLLQQVIKASAPSAGENPYALKVSLSEKLESFNNKIAQRPAASRELVKPPLRPESGTGVGSKRSSGPPFEAWPNNGASQA